MNKKILSGFAAALVMTACSNDDVLEVASHQEDAINFNVTQTVASRALESYCNTNLPGSFRVSAAKADGSLYFDGDLVSKKSSNPVTWASSATRFWTTDALNFHAWVNDDATYAYENGVAKFNHFTVNNTAAEQLDLLYSVTNNVLRKTVNLNFRHALSQVVFNAINNSDLDITISGVSVGGIKGAGSFTFPTVDTQGNWENHSDMIDEEVTLPGQGTWSLEGDIDTYSTTFDAVSVPQGGEAKKLTGVNHNGGVDGSLILMPQTATAWNPEVKAEEFVGSYFLVDLVIKQGAVEVYKGQAAVPVNIAWKQGVRYIYTFIFENGGNGGWTPEPNNPQPVLATINYVMSVDDFVPADNDNVYMNGIVTEAPEYHDVALYVDGKAVETKQGVEVGESVKFTLPAAKDNTATEDFVGYKDAEGNILEAGAEIEVTETVYYTSEFKTARYAVTFNANGKILIYKENPIIPDTLPGTIYVTVGEQADMPTNVIDADGYMFIGWSTNPKFAEENPDAEYADFKPGTKFTVSADTVLYAAWVKTTDIIGGGGENTEDGDWR